VGPGTDGILDYGSIANCPHMFIDHDVPGVAQFAG
jgi:hypothetical protein